MKEYPEEMNQSGVERRNAKTNPARKSSWGDHRLVASLVTSVLGFADKGEVQLNTSRSPRVDRSKYWKVNGKYELISSSLLCLQTAATVIIYSIFMVLLLKIWSDQELNLGLPTSTRVPYH